MISDFISFNDLIVGMRDAALIKRNAYINFAISKGAISTYS